MRFIPHSVHTVISPWIQIVQVFCPSASFLLEAFAGITISAGVLTGRKVVDYF